MTRGKLSGIQNRLKAVLSEVGYSVYEVSVKSGVSQKTLHEYVKNPNYLGSLTTLGLVAQALDIKLLDLLEGDLVGGCQCVEEF